MFAACEYTDAGLYNGWGWDPVAGVSCRPLPTAGACDYTNADSHGGWGWNAATQMSCPPLEPVAGACVDSDGDGWGWDGTNSCLVNQPATHDDHLILVDHPGIATVYDYEQTPDGSLSLFQYWGGDLHSDDSGRFSDVFVRDNNSGTITVLTVGENNTEANNDSYMSGASRDGSTVLVKSRVTNFAGTTANGVGQLYLIDVPTRDVTQVVTPARGTSPWSQVNGILSADGNYVAYNSRAANIVEGDNNNESDVFLMDAINGTTTRISTSLSGGDSDGASFVSDISADGRYVLFVSEARNLHSPNEFASALYRYDRVTQTTTQVRRLEGLYRASISDDGRVVAFQYRRSNGTALAWIDMATGDSRGIGSVSNGDSDNPQVSPDGRFVAYTSSKSDLVDDITVSGDHSQIYLTELATGKTILVTRSPDGQEGNSSTYQAAFTAAGQFLRFNSNASNLHSADTDTNSDAFLFAVPAE